MQRCPGVACSHVWQDVLLEGCSNWKKKSMLGALCRIVFGSAVYSIWQARNAIRFHGHPKSEEQILKMILWEVRTRILGKESSRI
jgi:hypothetical protein